MQWTQGSQADHPLPRPPGQPRHPPCPSHFSLLSSEGSCYHNKGRITLHLIPAYLGLFPQRPRLVTISSLDNPAVNKQVGMGLQGTLASAGHGEQGSKASIPGYQLHSGGRPGESCCRGAALPESDGRVRQVQRLHSRHRLSPSVSVSVSVSLLQRQCSAPSSP